jgi:hypothetical protein
MFGRFGQRKAFVGTSEPTPFAVCVACIDAPVPVTLT